MFKLKTGVLCSAFRAHSLHKILETSLTLFARGLFFTAWRLLSRMRYGMEAGIKNSGLVFEADRVRFEACSFE